MRAAQAWARAASNGVVNLLLARAVAEGPCHFVRYNAVMESAVQHPGATGFMLVHQAVVNFNRVLLWESRALTSPNVLVYEFQLRLLKCWALLVG